MKKLPLVDQYIRLVRKTAERPDGHTPAQVEASLLEMWAEAEGHPGLTVQERGRVRAEVRRQIDRLERQNRGATRGGRL